MCGGSAFLKLRQMKFRLHCKVDRLKQARRVHCLEDETSGHGQWGVKRTWGGGYR